MGQKKFFAFFHQCVIYAAVTYKEAYCALGNRWKTLIKKFARWYFELDPNLGSGPRDSWSAPSRKYDADI